MLTTLFRYLVTPQGRTACSKWEWLIEWHLSRRASEGFRDGDTGGKRLPLSELLRRQGVYDQPKV